jgi:hypothetical protein
MVMSPVGHETKNTVLARASSSLTARQLEEVEVGVRWPPACENVNQKVEERPLLEDVTKQLSQDRDWEN